MYFVPVTPKAEEVAAHVTEAVKPALEALRGRLAEIDWDKAAIQQAIKDTIGEFKLKMPQVAIPLRVLVCGRAQTPSIDAVLALFNRNDVLARVRTV
jgi:glutamyl-tRNA synthetase